MRPVLLLLFLVATLTACGGGSSGSSSNPSSENYDPAKTTLKAAGLESCSEDSKNLPPTITTLQGVGASRAFFVAKSCNGKTVTPNQVFVVQFTSKDTIDAGARAIKTAVPKASVLVHYPLVVVATGPQAAANLAAIQQQLPGA